MNVAAHLGKGRASAVEALERAGLTKTGEFEHSVNFRHVSGEPVQLAFDVAFDAMIERAESIDVGGINIMIVCKDDLIAMKRVARGIWRSIDARRATNPPDIGRA